MSTITINRGELTAIPFSITDSANGLAGKRVTWSLSRELNGPRTLRKVGNLPGTSADITVSTQTAAAVTGFVNIAVADYAQLPLDKYFATLWIDDGSGADRNVTPGGTDLLVIQSDVPRPA